MKNKKGILALLGIGVAVYIAYNLFSSKKNTTTPPASSIDPKNIPTGLTQEQILRYTTMANDLFDAMNHCGTKEERVVEILSGVTSEEDFKNLISIYGIRTLVSEYYCLYMGNFTGNLIESIKSELSDSYITKINNMLASKGVTTKI